MYRIFAPTANRVTTIKFATTKTYCRVKRCYLRGVDESTVIFFLKAYTYRTIKSVFSVHAPSYFTFLVFLIEEKTKSEDCACFYENTYKF